MYGNTGKFFRRLTDLFLFSLSTKPTIAMNQTAKQTANYGATVTPVAVFTLPGFIAAGNSSMLSTN
jgi:hypothetical protein